ncbi:hypothetical protein M9458_008790, partial [Cirrhinus mrigala]
QLSTDCVLHHADRIQLHPEKRDALHGGELALLLVDLKPQKTEVLKHQIPVLAQQILQIVENADALLPEWDESTLREFGKYAGRQGQSKGEDFVLICLTLESKLKKRSVLRQNRDM